MQDEDISETRPILELVLSEEDFDPVDKATIRNLSDGKKVLGEEDGARKALFNALPKVIAKRIEQITPSNFFISTLELKMCFDGKLFGVGISGDIVVTLSPKSTP